MAVMPLHLVAAFLQFDVFAFACSTTWYIFPNTSNIFFTISAMVLRVAVEVGVMGNGWRQDLKGRWIEAKDKYSRLPETNIKGNAIKMHEEEKKKDNFSDETKDVNH